MYSFNFPRMLDTTSAKLKSNKEAVRSNVLLLLQSEKTSLFGDPAFGTQLKRVLFEQNSNLIVDLIVDEIYTALVTFIPQIVIKRENITLTTDGTNVFCTVEYVYSIDNTSDLYSIQLTDSDVD